MATAQVSYAQLEVTDSISGQISYALLEISTAPIIGHETGAGVDSSVRTTSTGTSVSASDTGLGKDVSALSVAGIVTKHGTEFGFGFSRNAAAGLAFLFRDGEKTTVAATSVASKFASDSGVGVGTASVHIQDAVVHPTEAGVGTDSSTLSLAINSIHKTDTGVGVDRGTVIPKEANALPEIVLEVAFASDPTSETQTYTVVSSDSSGKQIEFKTKRGRQDELKSPETGTLMTILYNQLRQFDPAYTLSPYYPNVLPVRSCRLRAVRGSQEYFLFVGDIEQWPQKQDNRLNTAVLQANDGFDPLSQIDISVFRPSELPGARINAFLDAALWPTSQRQIDAGSTMLHQGQYEGNALELIRKVIADEDGYFFMGGDGKARFIERHKRFQPPYTTPIVTLSNRPSGTKLPFASADYQVDKDFIKNVVTVNVAPEIDIQQAVITDDQTFSLTDTASQTQYRPRSLTYDESSIQDANEAQTKVEYHLDRLKDPHVRVKSVTIEPQQNTNLWAHALGREIGDRIAVEIWPAQKGTEQVVTFEGIIEYVEHTYVVGRWTTVWYLSPADMNSYWILGDPVLGVLDSTTKLGF